jgi:hypothetical protein
MYMANKGIARTWFIGAMVGAGAALAVSNGAIAQNQRGSTPPGVPSIATAPGESRSGPLPAPVGHRQVKPSDLPPDSAKNMARGDPWRDLDNKLRICKGC